MTGRMIAQATASQRSTVSARARLQRERALLPPDVLAGLVEDAAGAEHRARVHQVRRVLVVDEGLDGVARLALAAELLALGGPGANAVAPVATAAPKIAGPHTPPCTCARLTLSITVSCSLWS